MEPEIQSQWHKNLKYLIVKIFFPVLLLFFFHFSFSQHKEYVDSLLNELQKLDATKKELGKNAGSGNDTMRVILLNKLSQEHWGNNPDKAMEYANQAMYVAKEIGYKKGIAKAFYSSGIIHSDWGEFPQAIELQKEALKICEEIGHKEGIADCYNEMGLCYYYMGNNTEALKNYLASLKINEEIASKKAAAGNYMNIGNVYTNTEKYDEALKNLALALRDFKEIGLKRAIAMAYNNIGAVYMQKKSFNEALDNFRESIKIKEELGDKRGIANACDNIGSIFTDIGKYTEAEEYFNKGITLQEEINDRVGLSNSYICLGKVSEKQGKLKEAVAITNKGLELALQTGNKNAIGDGYKASAEMNARINNYKTAYENHKLYKQVYDSLFNTENESKLMRMQMQFDFDKKAQADSLKFVQEKAIAAIQLQKQKAINYASFLGIGITLILLFFVYRNYNKQRIANQKLKQTQKQLIKSEKMAAFGTMASRVSHEIQNPLNFVNNFSELSKDLVMEVIYNNDEENKKQSAETLIENLKMISEHGRRASSIVSQLQEHSTKGTAQDFFEENT